MERLKPCPFCGAKDDDVELWDNECDIIWDHAYQVMCHECGVRTLIFQTQDKAIKSWNRRAENGNTGATNKENTP